MDDIIIFGQGILDEWHTIKGITDIFCKASGMSFSTSKSCFCHFGVEEAVLHLIEDLFLFKSRPLEGGFSYLGFYLKPNNYHRSDWTWLIHKVHFRIGKWSSNWLSLGGRLTLIKVVLQSIPVYWFALFRVSVGVLNTIRRSFFNFLWRGAHLSWKFHLTNWRSLSLPFKWGGWGIKNLALFNIALCAKSLWRGLTGNNIWCPILKSKYM